MDRLYLLLEMLLHHKADTLQLRAGAPPTVFSGKTSERLAQAPLVESQMVEMVKTLLDATEQGTLRNDGTLDCTRSFAGLGRFQVRVRMTPEGTILAFRPMGKRAEFRISTEPTVPVSPPPQNRVALPVAEDSLGLQPLAVQAPSPSPPSPGILDPLLYRSLVEGASDLIVSTHREPTMRIVGKLKKVTGVRIGEEDFRKSLLDDLPPLKRDEFEHKGSVDLSYELPNADGDKPHRFRVNVFRHNDGWSAAFRPIWETIPTLSELNLPSHLTEMAAFGHGLVLVTGPTGSGKSTTLSSLIEYVNQNRFVHIITLEDPIEYLYTSRHSVIHQREVGTHLESFASGLKAALRENPDIILVGEMRDKETVSAALTAAETGHLVLSTLHTANAAQAIDRMVDVFPSHQQSQVRIQLASVLRAVVTQRLLATQEGTGRIPVVEIVRINYALANLIREQKTHLFTSQIQTSRGDGMVLFDQSLAEVYQKGWISLEEALRAAHDTKYIKSILGLPQS